MSSFQSSVAPLIQSFIRYRKASDHWNVSSSEPNLLIFERYCIMNYPGFTELTQEMVDNWCRQRDTELNESCRVRIGPVVGFVRYLKERGLTRIYEPVIPKKEPRIYIPHAFTEQELTNFFCECDSLGVHPRNEPVLTRKLTVPVFFRLLYSSGIRTTEARQLRKTDVDMEHGILDIRYSKGRNQHYIALHDSMLEQIRKYDTAIEKIHPDRTYFFPARNDSFHKRSWVQKNFHDIWYGVNKAHAVAYELRHHYAVKNINRWAGLGVTFNDKLLYLSKSMGHTTIESTKYYYSIVPGLSQILREKTETGFDCIVPEVEDDESNE
ncbi:tyrosine-type recombinase/integrase [Clostridium estertheticum]|uniref:Tyrosine-type recombinase/integrase n=1 Tax=Clostridium estertheticum TaxID=238834 RepID=A0AA47I808_9CLOT|nr:tyrosine-type recombinase/integrase [Clostridium estertheticum]MBU3153662.1 tyrosine-type recombinase/integrase [Clostridium estertheticum]WAG61550.1 tyrosine-type recombinase/integrase [Clostridium estertheticum]